MPQRTRVNARQTTLAVLQLLQDETDTTRHIHITDIVKRLKKPPYEIATNRDTVKRILDDLQEFYPEVKCETLRRDQNGEKQTYTYGYWYDQPFVLEEAELTVGRQVKENITFLRPIIQRNRDRGGREITLDFQFSGYGSDGKPHPTDRQITDVLPLKICMAYGNFYLIGLFRGKKDLAHFRLDLMTDLITRMGRPDENHRFAQNRLDATELRAYLSSHLYMTYEKGGLPRRITLRVKKWSDRPDASLTFLYDAFGGNWTVLREAWETVDVQVECLEKAMEIFAWNYIDRVEILAPEDVRQRVIDHVRETCQKFLTE